MKHLLLTFCLVLAPTAAFSQESLDTNQDGKVDAAETTAVVEADATPTDVVKDGASVVSAAKDIANRENDDRPTSLLVALLLAAVFKLLLSLLKVLAKNLSWFKSQDGKRILKYSTIGLGSAAALVSNLAFGLSWVDALTILLSGPLSVAIHEYTSDSKVVDKTEEARG